MALNITTDLSSVVFNTDHFGKSCTYTPTGGEASTITVLIDRDGDHQEPYIRGEDHAEAILFAQVADVGTPQHGDTFAIGSDTWEYNGEKGIIEINDYFMAIAVRRVY